jgi:hypothetical protein
LADDDFKPQQSDSKKATKKKLMPIYQVLSDDDENLGNKRVKQNPIDDYDVDISNSLV